MASPYTQALPFHATLVGASVDILNVTPPVGQWVAVVNRDTTNTLWYTVDGSTPAAEGPTSYPVLPLTTVTVPLTLANTSTVPVLKFLGNGGKYSVVPNWSR